MSKYLLDANLSPNTATFLRETFGLDVLHQRDVLPGSPTDEEIVALAKREQRIIITFDQGFGEEYHQKERGTFGVVVLRLRNQRRSNVDEALARFFREIALATDLAKSLIIIDEQQVRIVKPS